MPAPLRSQAWLERIVQHLRSLPQWQRAALVRELDPDAALEVLTAAPLAAGQIEDWRTRIQDALASRVRIAFDADPQLIAGAKLHFGATNLAFSLDSALQALRAGLKPDAHGS
jgi:F0F1-type ATP synthase delta subunit